MTIIELMLLAFGVSLDAFSVSICKGLSVNKLEAKHGLIVAAYFGGFQGIMPLMGALLGGLASGFDVRAVDHWVILVIMSYIGIEMLKEAMDPETCPVGDFSIKVMLPLAIATSIDAFAVGITLAMVHVNMFIAIPLISTFTGCFSFIGTYIGHFFGEKYQKPASIAGGLILIAIGIRIFITHVVTGV